MQFTFRIDQMAGVHRRTALLAATLGAPGRWFRRHRLPARSELHFSGTGLWCFTAALSAKAHNLNIQENPVLAGTNSHLRPQVGPSRAERVSTILDLGRIPRFFWIFLGFIRC